MPPAVDRPDVHSLLGSHLGHPATGVVVAAIDGLAALGAKSDAAQIIAMRDDGRPLVRAAVLRFDARSHGDDAIPRLVEALKDSDALVRQSAIDALDDLNAEQATTRVLELASDPNPDVRQAVETFTRNRNLD